MYICVYLYLIIFVCIFTVAFVTFCMKVELDQKCARALSYCHIVCYFRHLFCNINQSPTNWIDSIVLWASVALGWGYHLLQLMHKCLQWCHVAMGPAALEGSLVLKWLEPKTFETVWCRMKTSQNEEVFHVGGNVVYIQICCPVVSKGRCIFLVLNFSHFLCPAIRAEVSGWNLTITRQNRKFVNESVRCFLCSLWS